MKVNVTGAKRLRDAGCQVELGVKLTMLLESEDDKEHATLVRVARELGQPGIEARILDLLNKYAPPGQ